MAPTGFKPWTMDSDALWTAGVCPQCLDNAFALPTLPTAPTTTNSIYRNKQYDVATTDVASLRLGGEPAGSCAREIGMYPHFAFGIIARFHRNTQ